MGVVPRDVRRIVELNVGSAELFLGVCMPDGVELPLMFRLVGAGLAEPEAVLRVMVLVPLRRLPGVVLVTERRAGRGVVPLVVLAVDGLRCGMREGVWSSVLSSDRVEPCRDGGFDPCLLSGRELGLEPAREPPGVRPVRVLV